MVFIILFLINFFPMTSALANEDNIKKELTMTEQFPVLKIKDQFSQKMTNKYYRFPAEIWYFDPLGLSYFPYETMDTDNWALLGRCKDGKTFKQMIYSDQPAKRKIIHGSELGQGAGYLRDFYLYADLFVSDNYPENTGSCFFYYSDSMLIGYDTSYGVFIDPQDGIYKAINDYKIGPRDSFRDFYLIGHERHNLELMYRFDEVEKIVRLSKTGKGVSQTKGPIKRVEFGKSEVSDLEFKSIGNNLFPAVDIDNQFYSDWESMQTDPTIHSDSSVKVYRVEIIRLSGNVDIYINGILVKSFEDKILTTKEGITIPDKVSWSYGPILSKGGLTVTCSIGNFVVYGTGQRED